MADVAHEASRSRLKAAVEQIERLQADKAEVGSQIKEVFDALKGEGFDVPTIRRLIKLRGIDKDRRETEEALLDTYVAAIGGLDS